MEKNEFKETYDEIEKLIKEGRNDDAFELLESINWRKVRNVNSLVKASGLCEQTGHLEEARELLYMAHDRSPIGRMIIYHLANICVKMGDIEEAKEFYDEFVEIAPHDSLKYIIKYNIQKAKGADATSLIGILEELKDHDFLEEWAFELAYLYHKTMQVDKCVDLCDEIILWFGDGPYVERALEMKMIYQPLDKMQEDKYRHFQQKKKGITEIQANELLKSGEIVHETVAIPQIELPADRFNTVNLQAEIKKNIDEIMRATEADEVSENMENIKSLVEEIPYLQVNEQSQAIAEEQQSVNQEIDATINDAFQGYLAEEYDGQISFLVPESKEIEPQVEGQMTIEDVMAEWEKTRRAAEAALQEAQQQKLKSAKNIALMEANQIMERLEEAIPKLDAGATSTELLREEYIAKEPETAEANVFKIPRVAENGDIGVGLEIPVVDPSGAHVISGAMQPTSSVLKTVVEEAMQQWTPLDLGDGMKTPIDQKPETSTLQEVIAEVAAERQETMASDESADEERGTEVDYKEASKIVADVNNMLQQEIDRIIAGETVAEPEIEKPLVAESTEEQDLVLPEVVEVAEEQEESEAITDSEVAEEQEESEAITDPEVLADQESEPDVEVSTNSENDLEETTDEDSLAETAETDSDISAESEAADLDISAESEAEAEPDVLPEVSLPEDLQELLDNAEESSESDEKAKDAAESSSDEEVVLPEISMVELDAEEVADLVDEKVLEKAISDEIPPLELSEEEKEIFSYFMPISGMENTICQALTGARYRIENKKNSASGNIIIQGGIGSGKTMLASNLIKVLQMETGKLMGNVGRIEADQLNKKDIALVLSKVEGGCLIIESAGSLTERTQETLRQLLSGSDNDVFIIMEDQKSRIEKMLSQNTAFAAMFTEKITIPIFTIDELVNFGKVYALEEGYVLDEMAILAMYNRINLIQRVDHPTSLVEVIDIMEEAIDKAEKGGIKAVFSRIGTKRYDEEGNLILREQNFEI